MSGNNASYYGSAPQGGQPQYPNQAYQQPQGGYPGQQNDKGQPNYGYQQQGQYGQPQMNQNWQQGRELSSPVPVPSYIRWHLHSHLPQSRLLFLSPSGIVAGVFQLEDRNHGYCVQTRWSCLASRCYPLPQCALLAQPVACLPTQRLQSLVLIRLGLNRPTLICISHTILFRISTAARWLLWSSSRTRSIWTTGTANIRCAGTAK